MVLDCISEFLVVEKGALLAPFAILTSTTIVATIAMYTIYTNRKNVRLKNSMDFINSYNESKDISLAIKEVSGLSKSSSSAVEEMAVDAGTDSASHIRTVLNYYESMAICISHGIYDDKIIKDAVYTTVIDMWKICEPYVIERRKQKKTNTFYQEVEALNSKWSKAPLKKKINK